jgi:diguanylate cyclase (GGDEF)-like protein/PAS domain S-box-containing protein
MENKAKHQSRLTEELESLNHQITELRRLVVEHTPAPKLPLSIPTRITPSHLVPAETILPVHPAERAESRSLQLPRHLDEGPFGMALIDLRFRFLRVNKALCRLLGYSREELESLGLPDITHEQDVHNCAHLVEQVLEGTLPHAHIDKRFIRKNKEALWVQFTASVIRDDSGIPVCSLAIIEDITERKRAEETLQLTNQKLEAWAGELEEVSRGMSLLAEMGDRLRACLTKEETYEAVVRIAQQVCPARVGALYVVDETRSVADSVAAWGDASLLERGFPIEECWALRRGRPHWVGDTLTGLLCNHLGFPPPEGYFCVPLMVHRQAVGLLYLVPTNGEGKSGANQRLALAMADHIAVALSNLRSHESMQGQSVRDQLTGLFTLNYMEASLDQELSRALRNQRPLGLIGIDLDHFDVFNKAFGPDAGQAVIRELGGLLQANVRKEDIACRWGEQRYAVVLPQGSLEATRQRAELLRRMIRELEVHHHGDTIGHVTVSVGVAVFPVHGRTVDALLQATDGALKTARNAGGDTVAVAH